MLCSGSSESGKSTIVKQMKIIHQNGFNTQELLSYRPIIYKNVLDSAQAIVLAIRELNLACAIPANVVRTIYSFLIRKNLSNIGSS